MKYSTTDKKYNIIAHKAMMAIQPEGQNWYLIEINTDQMELMKSLFSENVINSLVLVN